MELSKDYDGKMEGVAYENGTKYGKEVTKRVNFEDPTFPHTEGVVCPHTTKYLIVPLIQNFKIFYVSLSG
jgi:hypothetical protein